MLTVANAEEKYVLDARQYAYGTLTTNTATTILGLTTPPNEVAPFYTISVASNGTLGYTITATPTTTQSTADLTYGKCGSLTLDQTGLKGISGGTGGTAATCW